MLSAAKTVHPIQRAGTSQPQRRLLAADPATAPLETGDESRALEQIWQQARVFIFHEARDGEIWKSDWQDFFARSLPVQLALVAEMDIDRLAEDFEKALENFENGLDRGNFEPLFAQIGDMVELFDRWLEVLPESSLLRAEVVGLVENDLRWALLRLFRLASDVESVAENGFQKPEKWRQLGLAGAWGISPMDVFSAPTGRAKGTFSVKKKAWTTQLAELFQVFWQALRRLKTRAGEADFRQKAIAATDRHPAHVALLVAFLRLLDEAQREGLNGLAERHLDFFYRDVLGLKNQKERPDLAHLIVELDKNVEKTAFEKTASIKAASKDERGADILFSPVEQAVLNQAQVAELRTLFRKKVDGQIFAAPKANSANSTGEPFEDPENAHWPTLGAEKTADGKGANLAARLGFFVASPVLLLREGEVRPSLKFTFSSEFAGVVGADMKDFFRLFYSSKKGWEEVTAFKITDSDGVEKGFEATFLDQKTLEIRWAVPAGKPLERADTGLLEVDFGVDQPVVRVELTEKLPADWLDFFSTSRLENVEVSVENATVKNLLLSSDDGPLDAAKPFLPFGAAPKIGASLVIGSEEAFSKKPNSVKIDLEWDKLPGGKFSDHYANYPSPPANAVFEADFFALKKGAWATQPLLNQRLFASDNELNSAFSAAFSNPDLPATASPIEPFSPLSVDGFLKMSLARDDFRHDQYAATLAKQMATAPTALPNLPYTPTIRSLKLTYSATDDRQNGQVVFGHLWPFEAQNHEKFGPDDMASLLPSAHFADGAPLEGSLLIGLKKLAAGSSLALLLQFAEATADPDSTIENLRWEGLAGNRWERLRPDLEVVEDATHELTASGLVRLALPFSMKKAGTTILPPGLHWLRISATAGTAGVANLIGVHAQSVLARAVFWPENARSRVAEPLAAGNLGKLTTSDAAIKKISQPYESFGGRPPETDHQFRLRSAERLRHKGRAATIFDYERLVLQEFPEIWKAKCLPHTRLLPDGGELLTVAPGFVTVAVIPDIVGFRLAEKLRPRASRALLERIGAWLGARTSPFVRVAAVNPLFQPIDVRAAVRFRAGKDRAFYQKKLTEDVERFLTPWAFGEQDRLSFGGKIFSSSVLRFVEQLEYVDFLTDFQLSQGGKSDPLTVVEAQTERSVLAFGSAFWSETAEACPPNPNFFDPTSIGQLAVGATGWPLFGPPCPDPNPLLHP